MAISTSDISQRADIVCRRGDTFTRTFSFLVSGVPQVFTGCSFAMRVVDGTGTAVLTMTPTISGNIVTVTQTSAAMLIPAGAYKYDLLQTNADGTKVTRVWGFFTVNQDITQ